MLCVLLSLALAAEPLRSKPVTLALPGFNAVNLAAGEDELQAEVVAQKFIAHGVQVMTARDLSTVLGMERQKQLLGCAEDHACVVEMTAALGADGVIVGDLGKLGGQYTLNLKVLSSSTGKPLALHSARAADAQELDVVMENSVRAILSALADSLGRAELKANTEPLPLTVVAPAPSLRSWAIAPAALGVVGVGAGVALQVVAGQKYSTLSSGPRDPVSAALLRDEGRGLETGANVALVGGGVMLAVAATVFLLGGEKVAPVVLLGPDGAMVALSGVLP